MKVFHLINTLSIGGAELHLLTLCRHLKQAGVEVAVGYLKEGKGSRPLRRDFEAIGVPTTHLGGERVWDGWYFLRARRWTVHERPNILHTHLPRADMVGWVLRVMGLQVPWVVSIHDIYSRSWRGGWCLPFFPYIWRRADSIIAISHAVKDWLVNEQGVPVEKVHVVHYGIEVERFRAQENLQEKRAETPRVVGTIGRLEPRKGHETLIWAMPLVLERHPEARLLIAGHDPWGYGGMLRRLIADLRLDGRVELLGFVEDVPGFLSSVDVFAFASRSEGFGQVLIEAMAAGKPVVASRIPPITEIVVDWETGVLVPPDEPEAFAQAIVGLLADPDRAFIMGRNGRRRVEEVFSVEAMARKTLAVYERVLGSSPGEGRP